MSKFRWTVELSNGDSVTMRTLTGFDYIPEGQIPVLEFYDKDTVVENPATGEKMTGPEIIDGIQRAVLVLTRSVVKYHEVQEDGETVIDKQIVNKDPLNIDVEKEISVYEIPDQLQLEILAAQAKREQGSGVPSTGRFPDERPVGHGGGGDGQSLREDADGAAEDAPGGLQSEQADIPPGETAE